MNTIAVVFSERGGSSYHRQVTPHAHLSSHYPEDFKVLFFESFEQITEKQLEDIQLIQFHRLFDKQDINEERVKMLQNRGIVTVLDIDDYWQVPIDIPAYGVYKYLDLERKILKCLELADHVTTTTHYLANEIVREANKDMNTVTVIQNSINQDIDQFKPKLKVFNEDFIKVGWLGSESHVSDIATMSESFKRMHRSKDMYKKIQLILGGFSMNSKNTTKLIKTKKGNLQPQKISPYETFWGIMERIFTDEFKYLRGKELEPYLKYLGRYTDEDNEISLDKPYRRVWSKDVTQYMDIYNELDVVMVPSRKTMFNSCKSELKIIEAGFFGKAVIVSEVYPYTLLTDEGICLSVKPGEEHIGFFTQFKKLFEDPSEIRRLGMNLRREVIENYNMNKVNEVRYELYKELIRKRNSN